MVQSARALADFSYRPGRTVGEQFRRMMYAKIAAQCIYEIVRMRNGGLYRVHPGVRLGDPQYPQSHYLADNIVCGGTEVLEHATDGRNAGAPDPADIDDERPEMPDRIPLDLLFAEAMLAEFPRDRRTAAHGPPPERVAWANVLSRHGVTMAKIARLLRVSLLTVARDLGRRPRYQAKRKPEAA